MSLYSPCNIKYSVLTWRKVDGTHYDFCSPTEMPCSSTIAACVNTFDEPLEEFVQTNVISHELKRLMENDREPSKREIEVHTVYIQWCCRYMSVEKRTQFIGWVRENIRNCKHQDIIERIETIFSKYDDDNEKRKILLTLCGGKKKNALTLGDRLDKLYFHYNLNNKCSMYLKGAIIYNVQKYFTNLIVETQRDYNNLTDLVSRYWNVKPPTYKPSKVEEYIDVDTGKKLINKVRDEHLFDIWNC